MKTRAASLLQALLARLPQAEYEFQARSHDDFQTVTISVDGVGNIVAAAPENSAVGGDGTLCSLMVFFSRPRALLPIPTHSYAACAVFPPLSPPSPLSFRHPS